MPQIRIMDDDPDYVEHILSILLPLLAADPRLTVGTVTRLRHREGGGRQVFTLLAIDYPPRATPSPIHITAERVDPPPPPRRMAPRSRTRRELPPA
ncbi:hypothetical protein DP939_02760 [Spongiactinospora rosea]|uniref:Uncharacterized protein n=1 Tax=Spongiactinospora rosea TaxID=2248750 RepID=A0A366M7D8_9ACTN|nr:hypothetical protein [Spongiactinospora rosea]RBQ21650.1 hypothetical protein DP939_02760 [Spongiactinospora rosea]